MLGKELMGILYKGYEVPKVQGEGRYIDMGMSFKKNEKCEPTMIIKRAVRRKPGELMGVVETLLTAKWQNTKSIADKLQVHPEGVRNALERLTQMGKAESNGVKGFKQYRKKP